MQIDIPEAVYGRGDWLIQPCIAAWLKEQNLSHEFVGTTSHGTRQGTHTHYIIRDIEQADATAFKMLFPDCRVHLIG